MMFDVPDEILLNIFSKLNQKELFLNVALVNKHFHRISKDPSLLKVVILEHIDNYVFESVENLLKNATMLETFIIKGGVMNKHFLLSIALQTSKVLKTVKIERQFNQNTAKVLLKHGHNIEHLDLYNANKESKYEEIIFMSNMKKLKSIKFNHFHESLNENHIRSIALDCQKLKQIKLSRVDVFSDEIMDEFCETVKSVESLHFTAFYSLKWKVKSLASVEHLTELKLHIYYTMFDVTQVSNILKVPNLEVFSFKWDHYEEKYQEGKIVLCNMFSKFKMTNLKELSVQLFHESKPLDVFKVIIEGLGFKLQTLELNCFTEPDCRGIKCLTSNNPTLSIEDVKAILKKSPNLDCLEINGRELPEQFLCEIEYKYKTKILVDQFKRIAMRRFKTFNPRFFENMIYL